jgi:hypothetical protein
MGSRRPWDSPPRNQHRTRSGPAGSRCRSGRRANGWTLQGSGNRVSKASSPRPSHRHVRRGKCQLDTRSGTTSSRPDSNGPPGTGSSRNRRSPFGCTSCPRGTGRMPPLRSLRPGCCCTCPVGTHAASRPFRGRSGPPDRPSPCCPSRGRSSRAGTLGSRLCSPIPLRECRSSLRIWSASRCPLRSSGPSGSTYWICFPSLTQPPTGRS